MLLFWQVKIGRLLAAWQLASFVIRIRLWWTNEAYLPTVRSGVGVQGFAAFHLLFTAVVKLR